MNMTNSIADTWQCFRGVAVPRRKPRKPGELGELQLTVAEASILSLLLVWCRVLCCRRLACLGQSIACAICHLPRVTARRPSIAVHDSILCLRNGGRVGAGGQPSEFLTSD